MAKAKVKTRSLMEDKPGIQINSEANPYGSGDIQAKQMHPVRLSSYFIVMVESGTITYQFDLQEITVSDGEVIFAMQNQIFVPPMPSEHLRYSKILFDENTLALLPQSLPFLVNPLNSQKITLSAEAKGRIKKVFEILDQIFNIDKNDSDTEIMFIYLNAMLSELNSAYFKNKPQANHLNVNLSKYMEFKMVVETHLSEQPSIHQIAEKMALSPNSLYRIVKEYSGISPKEFFTGRLIKEAQRKLLYSNLSVKELAFELGFNDPDYFSRLFKKCTGKNISEMMDGVQDLS